MKPLSLEDHLNKLKGEPVRFDEQNLKKHAMNVLTERIEQIKYISEIQNKEVYLTFTGNFQGLLALKLFSNYPIKLYHLILPVFDDEVINSARMITKYYETVVWDYRNHISNGKCTWLSATEHFTNNYKNDSLRIASCILSPKYDYPVFSEIAVFLFKTPYGIKYNHWYKALIDVFHDIYPKQAPLFYTDCPHPEKCNNSYQYEWLKRGWDCKKISLMKLEMVGFVGCVNAV